MTEQDNNQDSNISQHSLETWMSQHKDIIKTTGNLQQDLLSTLKELSDDYDSLVKVILAFYGANPNKVEDEIRKIGMSIDKILSLKRSFASAKEKVQKTCKSYDNVIHNIFNTTDTLVANLQQQRIDATDGKFAEVSHIFNMRRPRLAIINPGTVLVCGNEKYIQPLSFTDSYDDGVNNVVTANRKRKKKGTPKTN